MNKQQKCIIYTVISILVVLILILIVVILKLNKEDNKEIIKGVGIYHNSNWNNNDATLILNDDMTCKYPNNSDDCKWAISNNKIIITLTYYMIINDGKEQILTISTYNTKEKCEEDIEKYEQVYNLVNPICKNIKQIHGAILGDNCVILYEHLFSKVG